MLISAVSAQAATEISYWLWDTNQLPAYKACAAEFQKQNPDITVKITQTAWSDYWTGISTGFVSGSAPDVFTDHLARYPEFALNEQLVDLAPLIKQDKVDTGYLCRRPLQALVQGGEAIWTSEGLGHHCDFLQQRHDESGGCRSGNAG